MKKLVPLALCPFTIFLCDKHTYNFSTATFEVLENYQIHPEPPLIFLKDLVLDHLQFPHPLFCSS